MSVRKHKFNGVVYRMDLDPSDGYCDPPGGRCPTIDVYDGLMYGNSQKAKNGLIVLLHECLHAEKWSASEKDVIQASEDIGKLLWRLGFRRFRAISISEMDEKEG